MSLSLQRIGLLGQSRRPGGAPSRDYIRIKSYTYDVEGAHGSRTRKTDPSGVDSTSEPAYRQVRTGAVHRFRTRRTLDLKVPTMQLNQFLRDIS